MKNLYILFLFLVTLGCYEDKGNYDYKIQTEATVTGINSAYNVFVGDQLSIPTDIVYINEPLTDVSYHWKVDGKIVSQEKDLNVLVDFPTRPNLYAEFAIIDNVTGIQYITPFKVNVTTPYQQGWVILSEDGNDSQLNFVRSDGVMIENIYQMMNQERLSGGAYGIKEHFIQTSPELGQLFIACQKGPGYSVELDGGSFKKMINTELEFVDSKPADFCPMNMDCVMNWDYLISAQKLYTREVRSGYDAKYQEGEFPNIAYPGDYELSGITLRGNWYFSTDIIVFDEKNSSYKLLRGGEMLDFDSKNDPKKAFNPTNMNKTLLYGDVASLEFPDDHFLTFLKDKNSNQVYVHKFCFSGWGMKQFISENEYEFPQSNLITSDSKFAVACKRKYAYFTSNTQLWSYNSETNEVKMLQDFKRPIRDIAICYANTEQLGIALQNEKDSTKSDFMVLDISVVGAGKIILGTEQIGKCAVVKDILYKVGDQGVMGGF